MGRKPKKARPSEEPEIAAAAGRGVRASAPTVDALQTEIDCAGQDAGFVNRAKALIERDKEILDRLADC